MPRNSQGLYTLPVGTAAVDGQLADPDAYNSVMNDIRMDLNLPRPVTSGGTGVTTIGDFANVLGEVDNIGTKLGVISISNNLSDLGDAATARTNLGLGTAAVENTTYFATAAQGTKADDALPSSEKATEAEGEAGSDNTKYMTPLSTLAAIEENAAKPTLVPAQATTSGSDINFTSLPAGITWITVCFDGIELSDTNHLLVRIGSSAGIKDTGYSSGSDSRDTGSTATTGFVVFGVSSARTVGSMTLTLQNASTNTWVSTHAISMGGRGAFGGGEVVLPGTLDRLQFLTGGLATFVDGSISIIYG